MSVVASTVIALGLITAAADEPGSSPTAPLGQSHATEDAPPAMPEAIRSAVARGVELLLQMQEGTELRGGPSEWPYQGVYRVGGKIPIGYRVGGTGICGEALLRAPGLKEDEARQAAIARAIDFVCAQRSHRLMTPDYDGGYDVRGWGYCYALRFLLAARECGAILESQQEDVEAAIDFYLAALQQIEIPKVGGWTYSRRGIDEPCGVSPFMTAPCVQTLLEADAQGEPVDDQVLQRGLSALDLTRSATSGNVAYSARSQSTADGASIPGAMGRMTAVEAVFARCGRGNTKGLAQAVDAFIEHWGELEKRRRKSGTHKPPYGVAPYYFFYAHYHAADAAELLPEDQRASKRDRINELLFSVREVDGSWNDRVFERSANYGTAMAILAMLKPWTRPPATLRAPDPPSEAQPPVEPESDPQPQG
ncbi:MAG: hypothetical protein MK101_08460 [Phycisphaerales bacterium]|nr:hypothetical protein [Phycisphaerales bacterium]